MAEQLTTNNTNDFSLEKVVISAVQIPGVKVNRTAFLQDIFKDMPELVPGIVEKGPVAAEIEESELDKRAQKLIFVRTSESSLASFAAGIPGGLAMAATVPVDILQFFGMSLRLAQELSYLYDAQDLFDGGQILDERVKNQLILYMGVMFGVSGAASGVRVLSAQIAKTTLKKLPQKALTKTFWYPIVKKIGSAIGLKVTKITVYRGIYKVIQIVGGLISSGLTFASMMPMANRLQKTLNKSCFHYTEEELLEDVVIVENASLEEGEENENSQSSLVDSISSSVKVAGDKVGGFFNKITGKKAKEDPVQVIPEKEPEEAKEDVFADLENLKKLYDMQVISEEEFEEKKKDLLARI